MVRERDGKLLEKVKATERERVYIGWHEGAWAFSQRVRRVKEGERGHRKEKGSQRGDRRGARRE